MYGYVGYEGMEVPVIIVFFFFFSGIIPVTSDGDYLYFIFIIIYYDEVYLVTLISVRHLSSAYIEYSTYVPVYI